MVTLINKIGKDLIIMYIRCTKPKNEHLKPTRDIRTNGSKGAFR
ncbi:MAG: hypothetical protein PF487_02615 [Bacteroidales bacterium]|nr:hypothetical protein [Bacteroidales bacterium]